MEQEKIQDMCAYLRMDDHVDEAHQIGDIMQDMNLSDKQKLISVLNILNGLHDEERAHGMADDLLLSFINDSEITNAFNAVKRWYA